MAVLVPGNSKSRKLKMLVLGYLIYGRNGPHDKFGKFLNPTLANSEITIKVLVVF